MSEPVKIDYKGVASFLIITFGITIAAALWLSVMGMSLAGIPPISAQLTVMAAMFVPGFSAYVVRRVITKEGLDDAGLRFGRKLAYLRTYAILVLAVTAAHGLTILLGFGTLDLSLTAFFEYYSIPPTIDPQILLVALVCSSLTYAPIINTFPAFGEEFGWRGYLLQKLLPLGDRRASILTGFIHGTWHIPFILIGYVYGGFSLVLGILVYTLFVTILGVYLGGLMLSEKSVVLVSFAHGTINSFSFWIIVIPDMNPILGGIAGLTSVIVFLMLAIPAIQKMSS